MANVYTIGSERGYNIVNKLQAGQSTNDLAQADRPSDKSVWTKNQDGTISVMHNGQQMVGDVTYRPSVPQDPLSQNSYNPMPTAPQTDPSAVINQPVTTKPIVTGQSALVRPSQSADRMNADDIKTLYQQMQDQQNAKIDYTVQQAVDELTRAQEDAQKGFDAQRNQVNLNEAQSRDAQVLYAAARGDRGGITARQYDSISNTAANNRAAISDAQQKLATDTARQIADLRAQGEFEKADALLQIAQQQLAQLWELQQYNDNLLLQEQQMAMQESQLTGQYNGTPTIDVQIADRDFDYKQQMAEREWQQALKEYDFNTAQAEREWAYQIAMQSIQSGVIPDANTLAAAGIDANTASQMASIYKASLTSKGSGSGGGTPTTKTPTIGDAVYKNAAEMYKNGASDEDIYSYLLAASPDENWANTYAAFLGLVVEEEAPAVGDTTNYLKWDDAIDRLRGLGVDPSLAGGVMSQAQWEAKKRTFESTGRGGGAEVTLYNTYAEYLSAYAEYCLSTMGGNSSQTGNTTRPVRGGGGGVNRNELR